MNNNTTTQLVSYNTINPFSITKALKRFFKFNAKAEELLNFIAVINYDNNTDVITSTLDIEADSIYNVCNVRFLKSEDYKYNEKDITVYMYYDDITEDISTRTLSRLTSTVMDSFIGTEMSIREDDMDIELTYNILTKDDTTYLFFT